LSPEQLADLTLVLAELVTNALMHGQGDIAVTLRLDATGLRGEVVDEGGGFEHEVRERGPDDIGGRGLAVVEALTASWGVHEGTTHVWFELPAARGDAPGLTQPRLGKDERPESLP
jgi:two-component sensor histidine kinase